MSYSRHEADDGHDHIDSDTPQSGIATPKPDPSDKRLPGIMHSYFQVGDDSSSSERQLPNKTDTPDRSSDQKDLAVRHIDGPEESKNSLVPAKSSNSAVSKSEGEVSPPLLPHEMVRCASSDQHSYPTPPLSKPPSLSNVYSNEAPSEEGSDVSRANSSAGKPTLRHHNSISRSLPPKAGIASMPATLSSIVTTSSVHASDFSNPSDAPSSATSDAQTQLRAATSSPCSESASYDQLKKLTLTDEKSHPPTPTRALSHNTSRSDTSDPGRERSEPKSGSPETRGAPVRAPRGRLTVKILEARGLRKSRCPYIVAVFQRNELVSKGPRSEEDEDEDDSPTTSPTGGIPISRQGSDSGKPMAIPMKSRQSSSTSLTERSDFKTKNRMFTNCRWDTEAVL
jgi:protein-serine/threonine kinase